MSCGTQPTIDRSTFTGEYRPTMTNTVIDTPKETNQNADTASTVKMITADEVATHNTSSSCYYIISGKVYDVTAWAAQYPGGAEAIVENCGTDVTGKSMGHPGGEFDSPRLQEVLNEYYVGDLQS